jgi:hypothetical protein
MESDIPVAKSEDGEAVAAKTTTTDDGSLHTTTAAVGRLTSNKDDIIDHNGNTGGKMPGADGVNGVVDEPMEESLKPVDIFVQLIIDDSPYANKPWKFTFKTAPTVMEMINECKVDMLMKQEDIFGDIDFRKPRLYQYPMGAKKHLRLSDIWHKEFQGTTTECPLTLKTRTVKGQSISSQYSPQHFTFLSRALFFHLFRFGRRD